VTVEANLADPFAVRLWPERLPDPLLEQRPRKYFVNSMSDLFHAEVPEEFLREIFQVMLDANWHTFQVLTKRPSRASRFWRRNADLFDSSPIPPHIWIGTSVEDQLSAFRAEQLKLVPASLRFLSCEPLIGPVEVNLDGIDWVIVGGESGPVRRGMDLQWAREIRDACLGMGVPFFFKQVGGRTPKAGGRSLDGRTWDDYPAIVATEA
jgi:protein gp37